MKWKKEHGKRNDGIWKKNAVKTACLRTIMQAGDREDITEPSESAYDI